MLLFDNLVYLFKFLVTLGQSKMETLSYILLYDFVFCFSIGRTQRFIYAVTTHNLKHRHSVLKSAGSATNVMGEQNRL